jgi:hypothetical protein
MFASCPGRTYAPATSTLPPTTCRRARSHLPEREAKFTARFDRVFAATGIDIDLVVQRAGQADGLS